MHSALLHPRTVLTTHKRCKSYPDQLISLKISEGLTVEFYEKDFIAQGKISNVYLGRILGDPVAIKIPHSDQDSIESVQHELIILKSLPKAVSDYFLHCANNNCLVFRYAEWDVYNYFKRNVPNPDLALNLIIQLFQQLDVLHSHQIYHGDIKPHNLLLYKKENESRLELRLADYGQSIDFGSENFEPLVNEYSVGTTAYTPPEAFYMSKSISPDLFFKRDIYAAGITSYFIATGRLPFKSSDSPVKLIVAIKQGFIECGENSIPAEIYSNSKPFYNKLMKLLSMCTEKDPMKRPSAKDALEYLKE